MHAPRLPTTVPSEVEGRGHIAVCVKCGLELIGFVGSVCPNCGSALRRHPPDSEADLISVQISVAQYQCDACSGTFVLDASGKCPHCGSQQSDKGEPDVRAKVRQERWRAQVKGIRALARSVAPATMHFASRGDRTDPDTHAKWLQKTFYDDAMNSFADAKAALSSTSWSEPNEQSDASLDRIEKSIADIVRFIDAARSAPPPPILLALHRGTTRAAGLIVNSLALFVEVIVASNFRQATELRERAQTALDEAGATGTALARQLAIVKSISSQPGWFAWDETFDPGRAVSELMLKKASSVTEVASLVRSVFGGIDEISDLPDAFAFSLAPAALASALWDPVRLERRVRAVLRVLRQASTLNSAWVGDPGVFAAAFLHGHRQLNDQIGILGFLARSAAPRKTMLSGAIGVYQKFSEGPLRRFGGLVRQATEVAGGRQDAVDPAALADEKLGKIVEALENVAPFLVSEVSLLIRNADAHYEFDILESGIDIAEPKRKSKKRHEHLTDDDFFELLFDLNELLIALEVALVVYISRGSTGVLDELTRIESGQEEQLSVIRALAGLRGWVELSFAVAEPTLRIEGLYVGGEETDPFVELLSTLAAIFGVFPNIESVEVCRRQTHGAFIYQRAIFGDQRSGPAATIQAGRAIASVLRATDPSSRLENEARYLLIGPVAVLIAAVTAQTLTTGELRELSLWLVGWLSTEEVDRALQADHDQLIAHLTALANAIALSQIATNSHDTGWADRSRRVVTETLLLLIKDREQLSSRFPAARGQPTDGLIVSRTKR